MYNIEIIDIQHKSYHNIIMVTFCYLIICYFYFFSENDV